MKRILVVFLSCIMCIYFIVGSNSRVSGLENTEMCTEEDEVTLEENTEVSEDSENSEEVKEKQINDKVKKVKRKDKSNKSSSSDSKAELLSAVGTFDISLSQNTDGYGSVSIDWSKYDYTNKNFKVYKKEPGSSTYTSVGLDYKSVTNIRLLQIYPHVNVKDLLKTWLVTNGYGKGIISVDSVYINDFNSNPNKYLKDSLGDYKYDVIFFGTWDMNFRIDLNSTSKTAVESYIKSGRGCIFGHDTVINKDFPYFGSFRSYLDCTSFRTTTHRGVFNGGANSSGFNAVTGGTSTIMVAKKGLITNYPWSIGPIGTKLTIPSSHASNYPTDATIWFRFYCDAYSPEEMSTTENYFLSTKNNCAYVATGHSIGKATEDEQKVLANLVFYMNQLCFNKYNLKDASAQDIAKPSVVTATVSNGKVSFSATDNGSTYSYYVESYKKNDTTSSGLLDRSATKSITVKTGVKSYRYKYTNNSNDTSITTSNSTSTTSTSLSYSNGYKYLVVAAVDGSGNIGDSTVVTLKSTITFNANGGSVSPTTKTINQCDTIGTLPTPTKEGYTFLGWYTDDINGSKVSSSTVVNQSTLVLYAHWKYNTITVSVPQVLIGDKKGNSEFLVKTNIEEGKVTISPPAGFYYKQSGKPDVYAKISTTGSNVLTKFNNTVKYSITCDGLSAGCWSGTFNLKISVSD